MLNKIQHQALEIAKLEQQLLKEYKKDQATSIVIADCYCIQKKPKFRQFPDESQNTLLVYVLVQYVRLVNLSLALCVSLTLSLCCSLPLFIVL